MGYYPVDYTHTLQHKQDTILYTTQLNFHNKVQYAYVIEPNNYGTLCTVHISQVDLV